MRCLWLIFFFIHQSCDYGSIECFLGRPIRDQGTFFLIFGLFISIFVSRCMRMDIVIAIVINILLLILIILLSRIWLSSSILTFLVGLIQLTPKTWLEMIKSFLITFRKTIENENDNNGDSNDDGDNNGANERHQANAPDRRSSLQSLLENLSESVKKDSNVIQEKKDDLRQAHGDIRDYFDTGQKDMRWSQTLTLSNGIHH